MRIKSPKQYIRKLREDFDILKRNLVINSCILSEEKRNNLVDCLTQIQDTMEDEIRWIKMFENLKIWKKRWLTQSYQRTTG